MDAFTAFKVFLTSRGSALFVAIFFAATRVANEAGVVISNSLANAIADLFALIFIAIVGGAYVAPKTNVPVEGKAEPVTPTTEVEAPEPPADFAEGE